MSNKSSVKGKVSGTRPKVVSSVPSTSTGTSTRTRSLSPSDGSDAESNPSSYAQASQNTRASSKKALDPSSRKKVSNPKDKVRNGNTMSSESEESGESSCDSCSTKSLPGGRNPMIQCDRCMLWFCLQCADMSQGVFDTLTEFKDLIWCCSQCKSKALSAVKADWDIESRCNMYFEQVTRRIDTLEASLQQKADRKDIHPLVKTSVEEVLNQEKRRNNVVAFNLEEAGISTNLKQEREQADLNSFLEVCNNICVKAVSPGDLKSVTRLGKKLTDKPRPLLVEFADHDLKREVMKNLPKLAECEEKLKRVRVKHDMSKGEREEAKRLYEQAKEQEAKCKQDGGKFLYRVRGPPWAMNIVKIPLKN